MAVNLSEPTELYDVTGANLGVAAAGIRYANRDDVVVIQFSEQSKTSAVFTQNTFCAAPVIVAKEHLLLTPPKALLINSGNANAVTGEQGIKDAYESCNIVAQTLGIKTTEVLPFSTGVIGENLPMNAMQQGIEKAINALHSNNWLPAAKAIMTTDTLPKAVSQKVKINGSEVTITGIAKGSGMICPNMATMLSYVVTDACVSQSVLDELIQQVVDESFNAISVDGDTSTNDAFVITATQGAENDLIDSIQSESGKILLIALTEVSRLLAQAIVRDGEGATKFVEVNVHGGITHKDCAEVAYTVAHSPLVKTALFASDPNWGRLLMAIGRADVSELDANKVSVKVNALPIVTMGQPDVNYTETKGQAVFNETELMIDVEIGDSNYSKTVWTTDLSHEYISINADYRS